jgi:hypothetical protein
LRPKVPNFVVSEVDFAANDAQGRRFIVLNPASFGQNLTRLVDHFIPV